MALLPVWARPSQANDAARHAPARSRRGAASSRVSLTHSLARKKRCEVTNRNLVCHLVWRILVSFLARPERPVQAARRRLPHTAPSLHCLAAFARPHPLASPAASCLRDAEQRCFSRVAPRDHRAGWNLPTTAQNLKTGFCTPQAGGGARRRHRTIPRELYFLSFALKFDYCVITSTYLM